MNCPCEKHFLADNFTTIYRTSKWLMSYIYRKNLQQPIKWGAHLVVHSATKLMDGQGRVLGGITVGDAELIQKIYLFSRLTGPSL